jgi:hypothetical protein
MQWIIVTTEPINDGQLQWDRLCANGFGFRFGGTDFNDFAVGSAIGFRAYVNTERLGSRMIFCEREITRNRKELVGSYAK